MVHCNVCKYKDRCKARVNEPLVSGCTSGHPAEFINPKTDWVLCPICGGKTRQKMREDTVAKNLPVFCRVCKNESVVDIKDGNVVESAKESTLKKCKDCLLFMNGCGFSDVDKKLNLNGDFVACGQFKSK